MICYAGPREKTLFTLGLGSVLIPDIKGITILASRTLPVFIPYPLTPESILVAFIEAGWAVVDEFTDSPTDPEVIIEGL